jgi:hypothetical protein
MEHNILGDSSFTPWTTNPAIAKMFAGDGGVVLRIPRAGQNVVTSPDFYNESEVLIQGSVRGAEVFRPPWEGL